MTNYTRCPKCEHSPLPLNQTLPTACPACGLILAKYAQAQLKAQEKRTPIADDEKQNEHLSEWKDLFIEYVLYVPQRVEPAYVYARAFLFLLFAIWGIRLIAMDYRTGELGSSFIHGPLLIFHEAGHVLFRIFGEFMMILGGTLGQLLMPMILCVALLIKNRDPFGASIGLWFVGISILDVAPYVYDALEPQLMLLSGATGEEGGHDWIYLLSTTGLINKAHGLGWVIHKLGAVLTLLSMAWGSTVIWQQLKVRNQFDSPL